jgi:hypothetical protein
MKSRRRQQWKARTKRQHAAKKLAEKTPAKRGAAK